MPETEITPAANPKLNWSARLLVGLLFAAGMAVCTYAGIVYGMVGGLIQSPDALEKPRPGVGMAPDLTGAVEMFLNIGVGGIVGAVLGLLFGVTLMWAFRRFLLSPLLRKIPILTRPD